MYRKIHEGVYDLGTIHDTKMICDFNSGIISLFHLKYEKIEYVTMSGVEHILNRTFWVDLWNAFLRTSEGGKIYERFIKKTYDVLPNVS